VNCTDPSAAFFAADKAANRIIKKSAAHTGAIAVAAAPAMSVAVTLSVAIILSVALILSACGDNRIAGSEVTNPPQKVSGYIRAASGAAAPGAVVSAIPADYDPVPDPFAVALPDWRDTTDALGAYSITRLDSALTYNVWGLGADGKTRVLIRGVKPDTAAATLVPEGILKPHGALSILIHDSLPAVKAYVYLAGTPLHRDLTSLNNEPGYILLDSVPAGPIPKLYHKVFGALGARTLLAENLVLRPGDTLPIGPYAAWPRSKRIFLNTTAQGAGVSGSVGAIPLLIRLDSADFDFASAREDGGDIRFTAKNGTPLAYELESWDRAARKAAFWVRAPGVSGNDSTQCLRIHWGNSAATSESRGASVFDTAFHFQGVWHLNALGAGTPPELRDASAAGNSAYAGDYPTGLAQTETPFGLGMRQNGLRSALYTGISYQAPTELTLSIWFRTTTDSGGLLIGFNRWQPNADSTLERDRHIWMDTNGFLRFGVATPTVGKPSEVDRHQIASAVPLNDGKWHQAVGTLTAAGMAFYIDGVKVGTNAAATSAQDYKGYWRMGFSFRMTDWENGFTNKYFQGDLDEGRAASIAFPEDWIVLSFRSQALDSRLLRFEPE